MTWAAFCAKGCMEIQFVPSRMKSSDYIQVLENALVPFLNEQDSNQWIFQQDNARIHVSRETKAWFALKGIEVMNWPAYSPEINPIENLWGILSQWVYANNNQFSTVPELIRAIRMKWTKIEPQIVQNLILSIEKRISDQIDKREEFYLV